MTGPLRCPHSDSNTGIEASKPEGSRRQHGPNGRGGRVRRRLCQRVLRLNVQSSTDHAAILQICDVPPARDEPAPFDLAAISLSPGFFLLGGLWLSPRWSVALRRDFCRLVLSTSIADRRSSVRLGRGGSAPSWRSYGCAVRRPARRHKPLPPASPGNLPAWPGERPG
jgi:hypothetical protein